MLGWNLDLKGVKYLRRLGKGRIEGEVSAGLLLGVPALRPGQLKWLSLRDM